MGIEFPEFQIKHGGRTYMTGCLPRQTKCGDLPEAPMWDGTQEDCPIVPRSEWKTQEPLRNYEWNDVDQKRDPACCLASAANHAEFFLAINGRAKTKLDWWKVWHYLSGGYGGVALDTAVRYLKKHGFPLIGDTTIALFPMEIWDIPSNDALFSVLMRGAGLWYGASGHAEAAMTVKDGDGAWYADVRGTWGRNYGQDGWYDRSFGYIAAGLRTYGAFAIREWELRPIDVKTN